MSRGASGQYIGLNLPGYFMSGFIFKRTNLSNSYYFYGRNEWVNGRSKRVEQIYLGTAENILDMVKNIEKYLQKKLIHTVEYEFGMVTLFYDLAVRLDLVGVIDSFVPKRRQGASVGAYLLIEAINRAVDPTSTSGLEDWCARTDLPLYTGVSASSLSPRNFWSVTTKIDDDALTLMENAIVAKTLDSYDIDVSNLIYDGANFFTYFNVKQDSEPAKRGQRAPKGNDLRIVGLSLTVSPDYSIPLIHETYSGIMTDAKEFARMVERLKWRGKTLTGVESKVTLTFDSENNSEDNINLLTSGDNAFHFVGGLKIGQADDLWAVRKEDYAPLVGSGFEGQSAYRMEVNVFDRKFTGLIVYDPALEKSQLQGIAVNVEKTKTKLSELSARLERLAAGEIVEERAPTVASVSEAVADILKTEYMKDIFKYEIIEHDNNVHLLYFNSDIELKRIRRDILGKTALFTDRSDYSNEDIVTAYRSAWRVERAFIQMKDTDHLTVRPVFRWTDKMIKIHLFTCVLAYRMRCLLTKELADLGINISVDDLIKTMSKVKRTEILFGDLKNPQKVQGLTLGDEVGEQILSRYKLKEKYFGAPGLKPESWLKQRGFEVIEL
jgi:transposase